MLIVANLQSLLTPVSAAGSKLRALATVMFDLQLMTPHITITLAQSRAF